MLQVALGGYRDSVNEQTVYDDNPVYYEPGFTMMSPLEMGIPAADQIYLLIRKRSGTSLNDFLTLTINDLSVTITDATTNEDIPAHFEAFSSVSTIYHEEWDTDPSEFTPLVLVINNSINVDAPIERVRVLTSSLVDNYDVNSFMKFRIIVEDENKLFHYLPVEIENLKDRYKFTAAGREGLINVRSNSDSYVLFSPFAFLRETADKNKADFAYPLESIYYEREKTYNEEGFYYSIQEYSHNFLQYNCSLINVPNYQKAGVLLIDKHVYQHMLSITDPVYVDIKIIGILSEIEDTFRIYLTR